MGWPKNTINVQVVQRLAVHYGWEKGPSAEAANINVQKQKVLHSWVLRLI